MVPVQVTFWTTASSPDPVCSRLTVQPGAGTAAPNEKPSGTFRTTFVVLAVSLSVGTTRVNTWVAFASATGGLIRTWANAEPATTSATAATAATDTSFIGLVLSRH